MAAIVALAVLAGWIGGIPALKSILPGYATMKPNTALSILLAAVSLWLVTSERADGQPSAGHRIPALAAAAIAGLTLIEYAGGLDLRIDQMLFADTDPLSLPFPGRMSAPTALCLAMFGIAISLPRRSEPSINAAFGALLTLSIVICLLALVGFLYGAPTLYRPRPNMSIAIHTAATLLILTIGAMATRPDIGLFSLIGSPSTGGIIARRLLPAVIALPLVLGWAVLRVHENELFDDATALGLIAFASALALTAVVWFTCQHLVNVDRERRESGAALRSSEAVFTSFAQNAPVAMYMKDVKGAYIFHNREGERVYGHLDSKLRGKTARDVHPADEAEEIEALDRQVIDSGKPVTAERHNAGLPDYEWVSITKFPVRDHSGQIIGIGGFDIDITKEKRGAAALRASEESLRSSESRYRHVVDLIHEAIWIHHEGNILFANPAAAELFGASTADALVGKSIFSLLHPDDRDLAQDRTRLMTQQKQPVPGTEMRIIALDGSAKIAKLDPIPFEQDGKTYILSAARDVTEQRGTEAQLRQTQKLEAVGKLTGGIAHDFNTLLLVIMGSLEAALERPQGQIRSLLENALKASQRGAALVQKLLAFSRRQALQPDILHINALTNEMVELLSHTLGSEIEIDRALHDDLWPTFADRGQVENALLNLALNARDAMPGGGKLTIETGNVHLDDAYAAQQSEVAPGDYVMLAVTDTGTGMTAYVLERALEPFFTTKEAGKGSGLGLSMIYGFAKQSRGHVKIYSEVGHGTTVRLYLPRHGKDGPAAARTLDPQAEAPHGSETILLVEDDAQVMELVTTQMESLGYRVLGAADGPHALKILAEDNSVALLFTDIVMPGGMNGRQLAHAALQIRPGIKILYTSGYTQNAIVHQGKLDQGVQYLAKPYRRSELAQKLRQILDDA